MTEHTPVRDQAAEPARRPWSTPTLTKVEVADHTSEKDGPLGDGDFFESSG